MLQHLVRQWFLSLLIAGTALSAGCLPSPTSSPETGSLGEKVHALLLPPVTFEKRYRPPDHVDLGRRLAMRLATILQEKGYRVLRPSETSASPEPFDAVLEVHVDFLFISPTFSERQPPPVLDIEAVARLTGRETGKELWSDRAGSRAGGVGGSPILRPALEEMVVLDRLARALLDTLPAARPARHDD